MRQSSVQKSFKDLQLIIFDSFLHKIYELLMLSLKICREKVLTWIMITLAISISGIKPMLTSKE